jgi:hypothetical protein
METKVSPTEEVSCMRFKEKNTEKMKVSPGYADPYKIPMPEGSLYVSAFRIRTGQACGIKGFRYPVN